MRATLAGSVIAEADQADLVSIEGNWYFPPSSIAPGVLVESPTPYHCPWKGDCQYYTVRRGDDEVTDGAWAYLTPMPSAIERVGADFAGYVAFGKGITVTD
ncbi:MAG TPA: DUF427 domain-containing protein [Microbacteriaceae bacterium]|nr:DUF427 domain-containing protein [Microbacteriaceae bacterium]